MRSFWQERKKILIPLLCIALAAGSFGVTYAYLVARAERENLFEVGETVIEIEEEYEPPTELKPGIRFVKKPIIRNNGNLDCFIRMRVDFTVPSAADFCELDWDNTKWSAGGDGYYYYMEYLKPGEAAEPLFTEVTIPDTVDPSVLEEFDILIYAESIQHNDHDGLCGGTEYMEAWEIYKGGTR